MSNIEVLLKKLDCACREFEGSEYGLPLDFEAQKKLLVQEVKDWIEENQIHVN